MDSSAPLQTIAQLLRGDTPADAPWSASRWQALQPHIRWHRVGLRLAATITSCLPAAARPAQMATHHAALKHAAANIDSLRRTAACLDTQGIRYLSIKGPALAQLLYGNAGLKQSADIDLLIAPADVPAAIAALAATGIEPELRFPDTNTRWRTVRLICKDWSLRDAHNQVHVELHWRVEENPYLLPTDFDSWYARRAYIDLHGVQIAVMGIDDTVIHILVHGARSLWTRLHWLADFDALLRRTDVDWRNVHDRIVQLKLTQILLFSVSLSQQLLATPLPSPLDTFVENASARQQRRSARLVQYALAAMTRREHYTLMAMRHRQLMMMPRPAFWAYELFTLIGPHHPDVLRLQLPIWLLPLYFLLRPWFVITRRLGWGL